MARWDLSRRGFLGATGAVTVGTASSRGAERGASRRATESAGRHVGASDVVLSRRDLVGSEAYVERPVDAAEATLTRHLRDAVESFTGADGAATGFVRTGGADLPLSVESAAFPTDAPWRRIVPATAAWFGGTRDTTPTVERRGREAVEWSVTTDGGLVDAARVDRRDNLLIFIVVAGDPGAGVVPLDALRGYSKLIRDRIEKVI